MFDASADVYDLVYSSFKNYAEEAGLLTEWLERYRPGVQTVLDAACGTGEHAALLASRGFDVHGIDINSAFIGIAREKAPAASFTTADMTDFSLHQRFDAVLCLFSSIGYVKSIDRVVIALGQLAQHLADDGVMLIEPWFTPDQWRVDHVDHRFASNGDVMVSRMAFSGRAGNISTIRFHYLIGRQDRGIEYTSELHELGPFTRDEMLNAFHSAGLDVAYDETGLSGRGLYIARHRRVC
jgi:SAM-dependent methyltransferase